MKSHALVRSLLAATLLAGCARIEPKDSFDGVRQAFAERSDLRVEWRGITAEDQAVDDAVQSMLASELTVDEAVQLALLNNRTLQATYEDLGIAQADVVQAGLLHNPVFDIAVRFPTRSGEGTNIEMGVVQDFLDIFFIPARKKIAAAQFESTRLRVANQVIELASDVRQSFYMLQGSQQVLEMRQSVIAATDAAAETARRLRAAGNITALELAENEALAAQARLDLVSAEAQVQTDREKLARLMGISGTHPDWTIAMRLPDLPAHDAAADELESLALTQRLDVQSAKHNAMALARSAKLVDMTRYLEGSEIGVSAEREPEGFWVVGPSVAVPIPLFDQGQASVAAARARLRQARQQYLATLNESRADVRTAATELRAARARVEHLREVVLPLRAQVLQQSQFEYNGMLIGIFQLLEAKSAQIEAGEEYIEALRDYWIARGELERAVGGRLPSSALATSVASTKPSGADSSGHSNVRTNIRISSTAPRTQSAPEKQDHSHHHGDHK